MKPPSLDSLFCNSLLYRNLDFFQGRQPHRQSTVREQSWSEQEQCSERHVQCAWYDSSIRPDKLFSDNGETVTVVDPGRWNLEAGPDFLDATIILGENRCSLKGDIEIHLKPQDWTAHGHSGDPAYSRVIAHVCLEHGPRPAGLPGRAVQIELQGPLMSEGRHHLLDVDITDYPHSTLAARNTRCTPGFSVLDYEMQLAILAAGGQERLRIKAARMSLKMEQREPEQVLYEEVMTALGYKHNRKPFRRLAEELPCGRLRGLCGGDPVKAYALLMGKAGLMLNALPYDADKESRDFLRDLWNHWWRHESLMPVHGDALYEWSFAGRPQNHPVRRIAAAACMFCFERPLGELLESADGIPYWEHHLSFGGHYQQSQTSLLGPDRKAEIAANILAPFMAACGYGVTNLLDNLPPLEFNSATREMLCTLMGGDYNAMRYQNALVQQGLIQVLNDYCLNPGNTCEDCRFADALKK